MEMKVSIITVVYNGEKYLEQTIQSIINQTYKNIEYIIIDGGSTDRTVDIIKKYEEHITYWVSEPDNGIYDAMNKGIRRSSGEIIGLLNADDWYDSNTIKKVVDSFNEKIDIVSGACRFWVGEYSYINKNKPLDSLKQRMRINHPATFVKRHVYDTLGLFPTHFRISADYYYISNCYINGYNFKLIEEVLTNFRHGGVSKTFKVIAMIENLQVQEELKLNNTLQNVFYFNYRVLKYILGKWLRRN